MTASRLRPLPFLALALHFAIPAGAQEVVQALPGTTDADLLAADMRRLAGNPRDIDALVDAARLSLRLDDIRAAGALLQRAENAAPRDLRVKAGQGSVLVQSERPGQALRYFAQAEAGGLDPAVFAADRALAYDLTGQQERAQRDYARALRAAPDDAETIRRYALSLGISGQRARALALLDPLVRRSDRAAWRSQAFVLAMTGDVGGAQRIAATMMPGGASGLGAFFERLPTLPATDRAFAVHFGEVRPTPERLADARLAPPVASLPREPVVLASAQPIPQDRGRGRNRDSARPKPAATVLASAAPLPQSASVPDRIAAAPAVAAPAPVRRGSAPAILVRRRPFQQTPVEATQVLVRRPPPPSAAAAQPSPAPTVLAAARESSTAVATTAVPAVTRQPLTPAFSPPSAQTLAVTAPTPAPTQPAASPSQPPVQLTAALPTPTPAPVRLAAAESASGLPAAPPSTAAVPVQVVALPPSTPPGSVVERAVPPARAGTMRPSEDSILAKIIAGLSIPGSELGVAEPPRAAPPPAPAIANPPPSPTPGRAEAPARIVAQPDTAAAEKLAAARAAAEQKAAERKAAADKKALANKKAAAEKKALADKKATAEKKALADKEAAEKKAERANPERIWVQVAGGAREGDLPKAYAAVKAKAPTVFGTRGGYTTPLRATNRVLTGPFKTDAEARAFVNDLNKAGVSAFTFTSDSGQPVKKLGAKGSVDDQPESKGDATQTRPKRRR